MGDFTTTLRDVHVRPGKIVAGEQQRPPFRLRHRVRHAVPEVQPRRLPPFPEAQERLDCGAGVRLRRTAAPGLRSG